MEANKGAYSWRFDPLKPDIVEVSQNGITFATTSTLWNAERLVVRLNSYQDMYEALKALSKLLTPRTPEDSRLILKAEQALAKARMQDVWTPEAKPTSGKATTKRSQKGKEVK